MVAACGTNRRSVERFHRDGRVEGLGEELGVYDLVAVERRLDAGADTNKFCVCVAQIHRDVDAALLLLKRDLVG